MKELMFDLETLDTTPSAIVLSVGAVIWETSADATGALYWTPVDRFYRILDIQPQADKKRTVSESTILWWQRQDPTAQAEAFNPVRQPVTKTLRDFCNFVNHRAYDINAFWANPATFDFPIWEDLALTFSDYVPWSYRQKYDVRTVVREAGYSAKDHVPTIPIDGLPHMPVYDCEWQIDLLTAARDKAGRRMAARWIDKIRK